MTILFKMFLPNKSGLFLILVLANSTITAGNRNEKILEINDAPEMIWPKEIPAKNSLNIYRPGKTLNDLKNNALRVYSHYWDLQATTPKAGDFEKKIVRAVIESLPKRIRLHRISDKIAIVEIPWKRGEHLGEMESPTINDKNIPSAKDLWVLEDHTWYPVFGEYYPTRKIEQLDLNGDGFEDIIIMEVLSDTTRMNIFLNNQNNSVSYKQQIKLFGEFEHFKLSPNCAAKITVVNFAKRHEKKSIQFDCKVNKFVY